MQINSVGSTSFGSKYKVDIAPPKDQTVEQRDKFYEILAKLSVRADNSAEVMMKLGEYTSSRPKPERLEVLFDMPNKYDKGLEKRCEAVGMKFEKMA